MEILVVTNGNFDYAGYGNNQRIAEYYYNLLTNMRGLGVTDPRMSKIVPAVMSDIKLDGSGKVILRRMPVKRRGFLWCGHPLA